MKLGKNKTRLFISILPVLVLGLVWTQAALARSTGSSSTSGTVPSAPKTYYFTWYDSMPGHGMGGDWIVIGNLEDYSATALVYFGGETTPRESVIIGPKGRLPVEWPNEMGGPVKVVSPDGATLVVTQRVIYGESFNEVGAIEESGLDTSYYFTWYDARPQNGMHGNWVLVSNVDSESAAVDIYIGSQRMGTYQIEPGEKITPQYPGTMGGPVRVISTNGQKIIASQRVLCNDGFNEVMGFPAGKLDSIYYFTWYDMYRPSGFNANWVLISNLSNSTVHAQVYVGNGPTPRGTYAIGPFQSETPIYPDLRDGPVRIVCTDCAPGQNILVSQRILYKNSFEEVQGTPPSGLSEEQYFGWYDFTSESGMNGNWVLVANQGVGNADVDIFIGSNLMTGPGLSIREGDRATPIYPGVKDGPVSVISNGKQPLLASQRVLYKDSFNELLGLTRNDVGFPPVAGPDLRLYKLNTYWANLTDFENRQLSVDFRIGNSGAETAQNTSVTGVSATNGVTVSTVMPITLGNIAGGSSAGFTVRYTVPVEVTGFRTAVGASCQDSSGAWMNYSF